MSDHAAVWKFAFGALVLLFCAVTLVARKDAVESKPAAASAQPPLPAASGLPPVIEQPVPVDVPEAQDEPVRIRIAAQERPHRVAPRRKATRHVPSAKLHFVRATPVRHPHASPYASGRQHYPFDPRERWRSRELPA